MLNFEENMNILKTNNGLKIKHAILILLTIILISVFSSILFKTLNLKQQYATFVNYIFTSSISVFAAIKIYKKFAGKYNLDISNKHLYLTPIIIPIPIILQFGITSHLVHLIPMPELVKKAFYELGNDYSWATLLTVIILAPVLEEIICRGIILKGLLNNYKPWNAILVSSAIFGIMHLNPWQFIGAFGIGLINGWVFWKTKNIILPILIHLTNNLFFTLFGIYFGTSYLVEKPMREVFGNYDNQILSIIICLIILGTILYFLNRKFKIQKN